MLEPRLKFLIDIWQQAALQPVGLRLRSSDKKGLMNELYEARRTQPDPAFADLSIGHVGSDELIIYHKGARDAQKV